MNLKILESALKKSWAKDTCYPAMKKEWKKYNPAYGQCYITALVVNDYFGGQILRGRFEDGIDHFWNLIDDKEIDLTKSQFDKDTIFPKPEILTRTEINNNPKYKKYNQKYLILKKRVQEFLNNL